MTDPFTFADELGPIKIIHVYEPTRQVKGILVVDNVAAGPAIGGLRMAPDVSVEECFRLARGMTLKNASAGLPHGGGKSVMVGDPKMPAEKKEAMLRTFASALRGVEDYIFGPDMGTNEACMACVRDEIGRSVGLPRELGGIPLDELGATAWGVLHATDVALAHAGKDLSGARFVIQGYGAVGKHAARFLAERGGIMVGAADSRGAIFNADGLDVAAVARLKEEGGSVIDYSNCRKIGRDEVVEVDCDVLIPAARPDVIHAGNVDRIKAKFIVPGANIPATAEAEAQLRARGILSVPDFIANAGGVICAALEYAGAPEALVFPTIEDKVRRNTAAVLDDASRREIDTREAALDLAETRVRTAMKYRRNGVFSAAPHNL